MASCCGGGRGGVSCAEQERGRLVFGGRGGLAERERGTGGHKARKPGFVQPSLKQNGTVREGDVY